MPGSNPTKPDDRVSPGRAGYGESCQSGSGRGRQKRAGQSAPRWRSTSCSRTPARLELAGVVPLLITATGHGSRQKCKVNDLGFPCSKPKGAKQVKGFQTGDLVRATVTTGTKQGSYVGRVLVRASGWFDIRTKGGRVEGINHRCCRPVHRSDGYTYQCGVRYEPDPSSQAASEGTRHSSPG